MFRKNLAPLLILLCLACENKHEIHYSKDAIVGGEVIEKLDHPYNAVVKIYSDDFYCSGTLVKPDVVLTAAHCLPESYFDFRQTGPIKGVLPPVSTIHYMTQSGVMTVPSKTMVAHEYYHPSVWEGKEIAYDVALIKLERPIVEIKPLPLLLDEQETLNGEALEHAGFGQFTGRVDVFDKSDDALRKMLFSDYRMEDILIKTFDADAGPCIGDSGGPLIVKSVDGVKLVGLLSMSLPHKAMTKEVLAIFAGESGEEANWDDLYEEFPDYDECRGGEFHFISTSATSDFLNYYLQKFQ